jgi:integrase
VPKALEILQERYEHRVDETEWVFPGTGVTGHLVSPKNAWLRIKKRAGLPDIHLHDLRRTLGSWQAATGASPAIIGKTLNHKDISTTTIYARLSLDPVRNAMDVATAAILKVVDGDKYPEGESEVSTVRPFRYRNVTF